jgi:hypothetical protein
MPGLVRPAEPLGEIRPSLQKERGPGWSEAAERYREIESRYA